MLILANVKAIMVVQFHATDPNPYTNLHPPPPTHCELPILFPIC